MDLAPTQNAITAQEYWGRQDMSLGLHSIKTDVTASSTAAKPKAKSIIFTTPPIIGICGLNGVTVWGWSLAP